MRQSGLRFGDGAGKLSLRQFVVGGLRCSQRRFQLGDLFRRRPRLKQRQGGASAVEGGFRLCHQHALPAIFELDQQLSFRDGVALLDQDFLDGSLDRRAQVDAAHGNDAGFGAHLARRNGDRLNALSIRRDLQGSRGQYAFELIRPYAQSMAQIAHDSCRRCTDEQQ